jgi:hypothetical protein
MSGPTLDDFRAKVLRDREHPGDWRVEKLCDDGESIEVAIFSGGEERQRAIRYAEREYGAFDEIELEAISTVIRRRAAFVRATGNSGKCRRLAPLETWLDLLSEIGECITP